MSILAEGIYWGGTDKRHDSRNGGQTDKEAQQHSSRNSAGHNHSVLKT